MKKVTILILTKNQKGAIEKCLDACLDQSYNKKDYDIVVVDDYSTDGERELLKKFRNPRVKTILMEQWAGRVKATNIGMRSSKGEFIALMNADCVPEREWLSKLMKGFDSSEMAMVSSFSETGGTSTVYRKSVFEQIGYFDEDFNELGTGFRDDTEMAFRIWKAGYKTRMVGAKFSHTHDEARGGTNIIKYALYRLGKHRFDPLLYKKHPDLAKEFFDVRLGFIRNPIKDFEVATGRWGRSKKTRLSSPQGVVILEEKTPVHSVAIVFFALLYVFLVKIYRLYGSLIYKKLLI
jgi:glycosyltransferase involved in cell wall biosynthesis